MWLVLACVDISALRKQILREYAHNKELTLGEYPACTSMWMKEVRNGPLYA